MKYEGDVQAICATDIASTVTLMSWDCIGSVLRSVPRFDPVLCRWSHTVWSDHNLWGTQLVMCMINPYISLHWQCKIRRYDHKFRSLYHVPSSYLSSCTTGYFLTATLKFSLRCSIPIFICSACVLDLEVMSESWQLCNSPILFLGNMGCIHQWISQ